MIQWIILITGDSLYKSKILTDGHLVLAQCDQNEFLAIVTQISYPNKTGKRRTINSYLL